jgi:hypothetical protein
MACFSSSTAIQHLVTAAGLAMRGHPEALAAEQSGDVEEALWVALPALEEYAAMHLRLAEAAEQRERHRAAAPLPRTL